MVLAYLFYNSWAAVLVLAPVAALYFRQWRRACCDRKEGEFRIQFRDAMQIMSSSLKAGYSVENAIRSTERDLRTLFKEEDRIRLEFQQMVHKLDMNRTAEQVLCEFAKRVRQEDAEDFATVFTAAKRLGGDSIAILKSSIQMIGEKIDTEREIQTMLAAKKLEFQVMCILPLGMVFYMRVAFPEFLSVLYGSLQGTVMMSVCLIAYTAAYWLGRKMIQIEV